MKFKAGDDIRTVGPSAEWESKQGRPLRARVCARLADRYVIEGKGLPGKGLLYAAEGMWMHDDRGTL